MKTLKRSKWNLLINIILLSITIYHLQSIHPVHSLKSYNVRRLQQTLLTTTPSATSFLGMQSSSDITTSNTDLTPGDSNSNMNRGDDGDNDKNCTRLRIGFIGCGTIASAIVTGFAKQQLELSDNNNNLDDKTKKRIQIDQIVVTRRSESKSIKLQLLYPNLVTICDSNQNVVDECDIIFITVLPNQTTKVLQELQFNPKRHILISLVSTSQLESLCYDSQLPQSNVYKMICLPAVAYNDGVCLLQIPSSSSSSSTTTNSNNNEQENETTNTNTNNSNTPSTILLLDLLGLLGNVVIAKNDNEMSALMVPSGLMGLMYGILRNNRDWIVKNSSLSNHDASNLIIRYYSNMIQDAVRTIEHHGGHDNTTSNDDMEHHGSVLDELIQEQTIGGLNEQGLANGELLNVLDSYNQIQDAMLLRILGQSDGSINR